MYDGVIGDLHQLLLDGPLVQQPWRRMSSAGSINCFSNSPRRSTSPVSTTVVGSHSLHPSGSVQCGQPIGEAPDWLLADYAAYCDPALQAQLQELVGLLEPAVDAVVPLSTISCR